MPDFDSEYKRLNKAQKEAVDTIEGPVMVVAGPGTGKTQVLALRIANILTKTDTKADSVLCLTFTNSGVRAMRERLRQYIGSEASKVHISTFHSFGIEIIEKYFTALELSDAPTVMNEQDAIVLADTILYERAWQYIRPRSDNTKYFHDLKSLVSFLKRERITPSDFRSLVKKEIEHLGDDPASRSSRGPTKGELKKEVQKKIESLQRTSEAVEFYELYENKKQEKNLFDYDDVLEGLIEIVEESEEALYFIREQYHYVLIDEHQDSSGVQNEFLEKVWKEVEQPNLFVVGDDRQLIYGFNGASVAYFKNFQHTFGKAKRITLVENYRSTQTILDSADTLLESALAEGKLKSNTKEKHALRLIEAEYPRDEILVAALEIKEKIKNGMSPKEIAILVPKNRHRGSVVAILKDMGIPVAAGDMLNFFSLSEAREFLRVIKILAFPDDSALLARSFFDHLSDISPLVAHTFISKTAMRNFSLLTAHNEQKTLFLHEDPVLLWMEKLKTWLEATSAGLYPFLQKLGSECLIARAKEHADLVRSVEIVRTILHLALSQIERNPTLTLAEFVAFLERMETYGEELPLAVFSGEEGVKVMTLHNSKGLEFEYVWIAHMDEKSFAGSKRNNFVLPAVLEEKIEIKDEEVLKRELYVAITRSKYFCRLSYSRYSYTGEERELAHVIADIENVFEKQTADMTEKIILEHDPKAYVEKKQSVSGGVSLKKLQELVAEEYAERKVSVSLLNNFFECPWKWYFRNLLQLPEPKNDSLEFGNVVHGSIDGILKLSTPPTEKTIKEIIERQVQKTGVGTMAKKEEWMHQAFTLVNAWVKDRLRKISEHHENEQSVSIVDAAFPHLNIYGKVDLIELLDKENVRVTDFKTGNPRTKSEIEKINEAGKMSDYMRQLAMYSYLLSENSKWKKNVQESILEFIEAKNPKDTFYRTVIGKKEIDLLKADIHEYDKALKTGEWLSRPCHFKSYGKQNVVCEYCAIAQRVYSKQEK